MGREQPEEHERAQLARPHGETPSHPAVRKIPLASEMPSAPQVKGPRFRAHAYALEAEAKGGKRPAEHIRIGEANLVERGGGAETGEGRDVGTPATMPPLSRNKILATQKTQHRHPTEVHSN